MDLITYERLVKTENAARKYLLGFCFENHQRFCPRCKGKKLYRLADDRRRCSSCRYTFHDFSGRWINQGNLTAGQWLRLVKLFELELSVRKIAQQIGLSCRELEFRYNHRKADLFPLITKCLCNLVPKRD